MIVQKEIRTTKRDEFIDITSLVEDSLHSANIYEGHVLIFVPHTTAAVTINENADPDVKSDMIRGLRGLNFENMHFDHGEGNSPAHLKSSIIGCSINVIISGGKLLLGTWQGIYFCEFDGPRTRKVIFRFS